MKWTIDTALASIFSLVVFGAALGLPCEAKADPSNSACSSRYHSAWKIPLGGDGGCDLRDILPRAYVPTSLEMPEDPDAPQPEPIPSGSLAAFGGVSAPVEVGLPFQGRYLGSALVTTSNMANRIRGGSYGYRVVIPYGGQLQHVQFQITSRRTNEGSKSRMNGDDLHPIPATWSLGFRVQAADENWQPTGPVLRDIRYTHERTSADDGRSRQLHQLDLGNLEVAAGQRMLFWSYSRMADPDNNHPAINTSRNSGMLAQGLDPPRARDLLYGDAPIQAISESNPNGRDMSVYTNRGDIGSMGIRYTDGREWGDTGLDGGTTENVFRFHLSETIRIRQKLSLPDRYFRAHEVWHGVYRTGPVGDDLYIRITGKDISTIDITVPMSSVQVFGGDSDTSGQYQMQRVPLPSPFIGTPGTTYTVEIYSPNADGGYTTHARRRYSEKTTPATSVTPIEPDIPPDDGEWSSDGGLSWQGAGWNNRGGFMPIGLFLDGHVASRIGGLP